MMKHVSMLDLTESFENTSKPVFHFEKKAASNIGFKLTVLKFTSLGKKEGAPYLVIILCMCCLMIGNDYICDKIVFRYLALQVIAKDATNHVLDALSKTFAV